MRLSQSSRVRCGDMWIWQRWLTNRTFIRQNWMRWGIECRGQNLPSSRLERILQKIDNRSNEIGIVLFNCFGLIDIAIVRDFLRWQRTYQHSTDQWIDTASVFDALVSMATFRMNEDGAREAEVVCQDEIRYEAQGLYHPFLGEKLLETTSVSEISNTISSLERIWLARVHSSVRWVWTIFSQWMDYQYSPNPWRCLCSSCSLICGQPMISHMEFLISTQNCWGWSSLSILFGQRSPVW